MKKFRIVLFFLSLLLIQLGCDDDSPEPEPEPEPTPELTLDSSGFVINENPEQGAVIGELSFEVENAELSDVSISITSQTPEGAVTLNDNNELVVNDATIFDFETNPSISVELEATVEEVSATATIDITINNIADYVGFDVEAHTYTIDENTLPNAFTATLKDLMTVEPGIEFSFDFDENLGSLFKGNDAIFFFNASNGQIALTGSGGWDFEEITGFTSEEEGLKTWTGTVFLLDSEDEELGQITLNIQISDVEGENEFDERVNQQGQTIAEAKDFLGIDILGNRYKGGLIVHVNLDNSVLLVAPDAIRASTYEDLVASVANYTSDGTDGWYIGNYNQYVALSTGMAKSFLEEDGDQDTIVTANANGERGVYFRYTLVLGPNSYAVQRSGLAAAFSGSIPARPITLVDEQ
ncbi:hypothetical protein [uncultured Roseivirga sp.]|uniref:hypothetical protein n=1 Tax=uncultured Roseivirga sp. TaxID=543088 RepID=UPI000D7B0B06|nr:hypothetical protein [uncultured Roseivirga sp.]PWL30069.1 MAG: hypothetical protein DCO95_09560 [Roseivirga sp. XM-24bin3]